MDNFIKIFTLLFLLLSPSFGLAVEVNNLKEASKVVQADTKNRVKTRVKTRLVDINTATESELKGVAGIGSAYAVKIIVGRPYANKAQLKSRKILPSTVYEQVKDFIIAKAIKK